MVIFCLKYDKSDSRTDKFLSDSKSILSSIPVVEKFKVLKQISPKNKFHFGFSMEFKDMEAYETYSKHPMHVNYVKQLWQKEVTHFLEIDFEDL
jgi:hypothetical protein